MEPKKFIHILWHNELKFSSRMLDFFNDESITIQNSSHFFVTPYFTVYEKLKKYANIEFYDCSHLGSAAMVNFYASKCDYLVFHNTCHDLEFIKIKRRYLKKIIWRSWGDNRLGSMPYIGGSCWLIKMPIKFLVNMYVKNCINHFAGIGVANNVDRHELSKKFNKTIPYFVMPYPEKENTVSFFYELNKKQHNHECISILLGHSGFKSDNHIFILETLKKFKDENINIYVVLSYGNKEYIRKVKEYIKQNWKEKVTVIDQFLDYRDYLNLLSTMDIAIFDGVHSYALDNIAIMLLLKKKIFLNRKGVLRETFSEENIPFKFSDSISIMSFYDFSQPIVYKNNSWEKLSLLTYEQCVQYWNEIIQFYSNQ